MAVRFPKDPEKVIGTRAREIARRQYREGIRSHRDLVGKRQFLDLSFEIEDREAAIDVEKRTVEMTILSDQPIQQWWFGRVILDHKKASVRMDRMKAGAPLLLNHRTDQQIGVLENVRVKDGKTTVTARFSRSTLAEEVFQDVRDGIRRNTSGGFVIHEIKLEKSKDGEDDTYRALDWEPFEGSIASIPADISVGVGRSMEVTDEEECELDADDCEDDDCLTHSERSLEESEPRAVATGPRGSKSKNSPQQNHHRSRNMPDDPKDKKPAAEPTAAEKLTARISEFTTVAEASGTSDAQKTQFRTMATTLALDDTKTLDDLKRSLLEEMKKTETALAVADPAALAARSGVTIEPTFYSVPKNFRCATRAESAQRAYRFGMWGLATLSQTRSHFARTMQPRAIQYCKDNGIPLLQVRGQSESVNEAGGYTVPHEFGNDIIALFEQYGVFRANAKIVPMISDSRSDPRREGGLEAFWEDEGIALEESEKKWGRVGLKAKKLTTLDHYSSEINEDSVVNFGDDLAGEMALAHTFKEDRAGFIGAAEAANGGITGICTKLKSLKLADGSAATVAQISGLKVATGTGSYNGILLTDFSKTKAKLPAYAFRQTPKWYINPGFYSEVVEPLIMSAGGITADMIAAGSSMRLLGYEVVPTIIMPSVWAIDQIVALFGVLPLAARMGIRRELDIALSEHVRFNTDEIVIRGIQRLDINVHDVGGASATASERALGAAQAPGPIVGLITAHT